MMKHGNAEYDCKGCGRFVCKCNKVDQATLARTCPYPQDAAGIENQFYAIVNGLEKAEAVRRGLWSRHTWAKTPCVGRINHA